jgi:hypothetical protein
MNKARKASRVQKHLTAAQWVALDYVAKQSGPDQKPWVPTTKLCTAMSAKKLHELGCLKYAERWTDTRGRGGLVLERRVRITAYGRRVLALGPPEHVTVPPGSYSWGVR